MPWQNFQTFWKMSLITRRFILTCFHWQHLKKSERQVLMNLGDIGWQLSWCTKFLLFVLLRFVFVYYHGWYWTVLNVCYHYVMQFWCSLMLTDGVCYAICPQLSLVKSFLNPSGCEHCASLTAISCQHVDKSAATMPSQTFVSAIQNERVSRFDLIVIIFGDTWFKSLKRRVYECVKLILKQDKKYKKKRKWLSVFKPVFFTNLQN